MLCVFVCALPWVLPDVVVVWLLEVVVLVTLILVWVETLALSFVESDEPVSPDCTAIACKGVRHCERDNRTIACRGFPFYPYLTRQKEFVGIGTYWVFEDRCWMMSNLEIVDRAFIDQFVATYEALFIKDPSEFTTYVDFSAAARRVYSRWKREIPLLSRTGELLIVTPKTGEIRKGTKKDYPKIAPFDSEKNYRAAIKDEGGEVPKEGLRAA